MTKNLVRQSYNKAAKDYLKNRDQFKSNKYLEKLIKLLKPGNKILDLGCGAGRPIAKFLMDRGFKVIGIDISEKQIKLAKENVPQAEFHAKDMDELKKEEYKVDAVVSFYAIFHIPREKHQDLFKKINSFLPKGGLILVTMGSTDWEGTESDFHGAKMYWSHYDAGKNKEIVKKVGFKILLDKIDRSGGEKHQVIIARKL